MPEYPSKFTETIGNGKWNSWTLGSGNVVVISGNALEADGWVRNGLVYTKGDDMVRYDGVYWEFNGKKVNTMDEIKQK